MPTGVFPDGQLTVRATWRADDEMTKATGGCDQSVPAAVAGRRGSWIYVAGAGRSGTTLLGRLLEEACEGFDCGELVYLWSARARGWLCECGEPVATCPVWSEVARQVRRHVEVGTDWEVIERMRDLIVPPLPTYLRRLRPRAHDIALRAATEQAVECVTGADVVIDTSKRLLPLATAAAVDRPLTVVHLVRDPRGVAYSNMQPKRDPARGGAFVMTPRPARVSAWRWLAANALTERVVAQERQGSRTMRVARLCYEDVARDTAAALRPVAGAAAAAASAGVGGTQRHAIVGNPSRFDRRAVSEDRRWREGLDLRSRVVVNLVTAPLAVRYGYLRPW